MMSDNIYTEYLLISMSYVLSGVGSRRQQVQDRNPGLHLPRDPLQILLGASRCSRPEKIYKTSRKFWV